MLTSIIFDAEGVVIHTKHIWHESTKRFLAERGIEYNEEIRERLKPLLVGRSVSEGAQIMKEMFGFDGDADDLGEERMEYAREKFHMDVEFIPGFLTFFESIRNSYKTCIGSAMRPEFMAIVKRTMALEELFGSHIYSLEHGGHKGKPNPAIFLHCAKQLGSKPEECVVIEDAPNGIEAAHRAGMKCIGIATTFRREQIVAADQVVDNFEQINLHSL